MKKVASIILILVLLVCSSAFLVVSAESDFQIEDGVLVSYTGKESYVEIPSSVYYIGDNAFENNSYVKTIMLTDNVKYIGNKSFYNCTSLNVLGGASSVVSVGAFALNETPYLKSMTGEFINLNGVLIDYNGTSSAVTVPSDVKSIAPYVFYNNTKITSLKFSGKTNEIGEGAFYGCTNLETVSVPTSVSTIGAYAFYDTKWLKNQTGQVVAGKNILIAYNGSESAVSVKSGVEKIAPCVFIKNTNLKSVSFPSSLYVIGMRSFAECTNLKSVSFPKNLVLIDQEAFAKCSSIAKLILPKNVRSVSKGAFTGCTNLTRVELGGYLQAISYGAFAGCESLKTVYIRDSLYKIEDNTFYGCDSLEYVRLPASVTEIEEDAFNNCSNVTVYAEQTSYIVGHCTSKSISCSKELGDVDGNGSINIVDATYIQMYLAKLKSFSEQQLINTDSNYSGDISILDATFIQSKIAKLD